MQDFTSALISASPASDPASTMAESQTRRVPRQRQASRGHDDPREPHWAFIRHRRHALTPVVSVLRAHEGSKASAAGQTYFRLCDAQARMG